jgi:putative membrane protein
VTAPITARSAPAGAAIRRGHPPDPTRAADQHDPPLTRIRSWSTGHRISAGLVGAGVLAQICYPLLSGTALQVATVLSVLLLAAAAMLHCGVSHGPRAALTLLVVAGGLGLGAETLGVHTGFPFGDYAYTGRLGIRLAGVPLLVPLAWTMLAYPCLLLGRRLGAGGSRSVSIVAGALALAGWDLFLDPQMVAQGNWVWADPTPALPGVPGVPLTNYAGWLLVSLLLIAALHRVIPVQGPAAGLHGSESRVNEHSIPAAVMAWTWLGSAVGNLMFFDRPWVALYGGLAMGAVTLPYLFALVNARDRARS